MDLLGLKGRDLCDDLTLFQLRNSMDRADMNQLFDVV